MSNYVFSYRRPSNQAPDATQDAAWGRWFGEIGASVVDPGSRVGKVTALGLSDTDDGTVLTGYSIVSVENFEAAVAMAKGCPGLGYGGAVEVGETVPAS
jgi:hypothetical protein